jgi:hypothetical protein
MTQQRQETKRGVKVKLILSTWNKVHGLGPDAQIQSHIRQQRGGGETRRRQSAERPCETRRYDRDDNAVQVLCNNSIHQHTSFVDDQKQKARKNITTRTKASPHHFAT